MLAHSTVLDEALIASVLRSRDRTEEFRLESHDNLQAVAFHFSHPPISTQISTSLPALERELILKAFEGSGANLSRAARELGIPRSTLRDRLKKYGVR
jgi:DNA-binding NtrC family response regulator